MAQSTNSFRFPLLAAGLFGLTGVALGALGAHALAARLAERGTAHAWQTAAHYQVFHTLALLAVATWLRGTATAGGTAESRLVWAARCWSMGIILFSGSLYWLAAGGPRWLGPITPFGGVAMMAGWLLVAVAAFGKDAPADRGGTR